MSRKPKFFKTEKPNRNFKKKPNAQPYLSSGTAVGAGQATLFSCQVGQWSGEVTAVTFHCGHSG
jgi:hypothetical protein